MLQGCTIEKFHHDVGAPILLADVVNHADVGMVEGGGSLRFTLETRQGLRVFRYIIRQELERHEAVQAGVLGLVNHTHSAAAQLLDDAVA